MAQAVCLVGNTSTTLVSVCWSCQVVLVTCYVIVCIRRSVACLHELILQLMHGTEVGRNHSCVLVCVFSLFAKRLWANVCSSVWI